MNYHNFNILHFEKIDSTNSKAMEMAVLGQLNDRGVILADEQNSGRGRLNRVWVSDKGNLYFSLLLRPKIAISNVSELSFVSISALSLVISEILPNSDIKLKWPNDLLVNGKKISGILLESKISAQNLDFVVIGIGVNLVSSPQNTLFPATNIKDYGALISNIEMLKKFLDKFEDLYQNYLEFGFKKARNIWLDKAYKLKEEISVKIDEQEIRGVFENIDEAGNLILRTKTGEKKINCADVGV